MPWTEQEAVAFVEHHIEVWNKHDLEEILQLYTEDVELVSPFAGQVVGSDVVRGRDGLREYFGTALAKNPDLRFEIVDVLRCVDSVTIYMRGVGGPHGGRGAVRRRRGTDQQGAGALLLFRALTAVTLAEPRLRAQDGRTHGPGRDLTAGHKGQWLQGFPSAGARARGRVRATTARRPPCHS